MGYDEGVDARGVGRKRTARIETEPADPQKTRAENGERKVVRR